MKHVYLLADDLTGAADSAAGFAGRGVETWLALDAEGLAGAQGMVTAFSTESRACTPEEARQRVCAAVQALPILQAGDLIFKKVDSTLRGHPGVELRALAEQLGNPGVIIAPAFPAQGRVTRGGAQFVHGRAVDDPALGYGVPSADLCEVFAPARRYTPGRDVLAARDGGWWVADAEDDAALDALVQDVLAAGLRLVCGSGGLGAALARAMVPDKPPAPLPAPARAGTLVVAGSYHPQTLAQVLAADQAGIRVVELPEITPDTLTQAYLAGEVARALASPAHACILSSRRLPFRAGQEGQVAQTLAKATLGALAVVQPGRLVLTGGDIASAVCRAGGAHALHLLGETAPGVPLGVAWGGALDGLQVVTKSGGFGGAGLLLKLVAG